MQHRGGTQREPAFPEGLAFVRPPVPALDRVRARLEASYRLGQLTNGPLVRELEAALADRLGVAHVVAVASCTAGLMLTFRALAPAGPVILPSFTFSASAHAVAWVGARPRFIECEPVSFLADIDDGLSRIDGAGALLITHTFGAPAAPGGWEKVAADAGIPLVFDAAHALGSRHRGTPIGGFGDAEVFSMSPTKPVIAGEGGIVATNRADIAEVVRIGRDYGNPGDYDTRFVGLNARLSEFHAATALESLAGLDEHLVTRAGLAARYRDQLADIPGIRVQGLEPDDESTWKDFTIAIDAAGFGCTRDALASTLRAEGIDTRCYFDPPVHRQQSHAASADRPLPTTDRVASEVISLPLYPALDFGDVDRVVSVIADAGRDASTGVSS
jgi:dTDP-4-amino-4,6-dideoxygalactose transaminase